MKITDDSGIEYQVRSASAGYQILRKLLAPIPKAGPRPWAQHTEKFRVGFRARFVDQGKLRYGLTRATRAEAAEDYARLRAGESMAPPTIGNGSAHVSHVRAEAARKRYATMKAASGDGRVHLGPATCRACGAVGHKANCCPAKGWEKKAYVPVGRIKQPKSCTFCHALGHFAPTCPNRRALIASRARRAA